MGENSLYFLPDDLINDAEQSEYAENNKGIGHKRRDSDSMFDDPDRIGSLLAGIGLDPLPEPTVVDSGNSKFRFDLSPPPEINSVSLPGSSVQLPQPAQHDQNLRLHPVPSDLRATAASYVPPTPLATFAEETTTEVEDSLLPATSRQTRRNSLPGPSPPGLVEARALEMDGWHSPVVTGRASNFGRSPNVSGGHFDSIVSPRSSQLNPFGVSNSEHTPGSFRAETLTNSFKFGFESQPTSPEGSSSTWGFFGTDTTNTTSTPMGDQSILGAFASRFKLRGSGSITSNAALGITNEAITPKVLTERESVQSRSVHRPRASSSSEVESPKWSGMKRFQGEVKPNWTTVVQKNNNNRNSSGSRAVLARQHQTSPTPNKSDVKSSSTQPESLRKESSGHHHQQHHRNETPKRKETNSGSQVKASVRPKSMQRDATLSNSVSRNSKTKTKKKNSNTKQDNQRHEGSHSSGTKKSVSAQGRTAVGASSNRQEDDWQNVAAKQSIVATQHRPGRSQEMEVLRRQLESAESHLLGEIPSKSNSKQRDSNHVKITTAKPRAELQDVDTLKESTPQAALGSSNTNCAESADTDILEEVNSVTDEAAANTETTSHDDSSNKQPVATQIAPSATKDQSPGTHHTKQTRDKQNTRNNSKRTFDNTVRPSTTKPQARKREVRDKTESTIRNPESMRWNPTSALVVQSSKYWHMVMTWLRWYLSRFSAGISNGLLTVWNGIAKFLGVLMQVHTVAFSAMSTNHAIGMCYASLYLFPLMVSTAIPWTPPWGPVCLWYAFLIQLLCSNSSKRSMFFRVAIPLGFMMEGVSHPTFLMTLKGAELLLAAFVLAAVRTMDHCSMLVVASFSIQVLLTSFAVEGTIQSAMIQWIILLIGLLTLNAEPIYLGMLVSRQRSRRGISNSGSHKH